MSSLYFIVFDKICANAVIGWNLFVAAMTPNSNLRSDIIRRAHNKASIYGNQSIGAFPIRYNRINGADFPGIGIGR